MAAIVVIAGMRTVSLLRRERILAAYDRQQNTREEIARRFGVSLGMIKKLLQQRRQTGDIAPQHHRSGRKPKLLPSHHRRLQTLLARQPDLTLRQLRTALKLKCSLPAIHYVLEKLGLTRRERHDGTPNGSGSRSRRRRSSAAGRKRKR